MLELLVVLVVAGILVGYAIPAYQTMVRGNRLSGQANTVLVDLYMARSEAIRRSTTVTMCASSDQATCNLSGVGGSTPTWAKGWIIFVPQSSSAPATVGTGTIIAIQQALSGNNTMTAADTAQATLIGSGSVSTNDYISYNANGFSNTNGYFRLCDFQGLKVVPANAVLINFSGRPQMSKVDASGTNIVNTCP